MKELKILTVFFGALILSLGSCSKTGPAGPQGGQGEQGKQGDAGPQGIPGANGSTIYSAGGVPSADLGETGDYYLDKSTGKFYGPKTDAGWGNPISLQGAAGATGAQGPKGDKGDTGATGVTGAQGPKGDKGDTGATGVTGAQGPKGDKGDTGATGATGAQGEPGKDGSEIFSGTNSPAASLGEPGDYYFDSSNYVIYGPKITSGWNDGVSLRGPQGEKGDDGNANVTQFSYGSFSYPDKKVFPFDYTYAKLGNSLIYAYAEKDIIGVQFTTYWYPLPGNTNSGASYNVFYQASVSLNLCQMGLSSTSSTEEHFDGLRILVVEANNLLRNGKAPPDPKDYEAMCRYYGVPD